MLEQKNSWHILVAANAEHAESSGTERVGLLRWPFSTFDIGTLSSVHTANDTEESAEHLVLWCAALDQAWREM